MPNTRRRWTKEEKEMIEKLKARMMQDLGVRGLKDADISGASLTFDAEDGGVVSFCYAVDLVGGGSLTYALDRLGRFTVNGQERGEA